MNKVFNERGIVLVGCGFMGKALLEGWIANGINPDAVYVQDPFPSDWLKSQPGLQINKDLPVSPAVIIIAVKPQILGDILSVLKRTISDETIVISIAAGAQVDLFEEAFGSRTAIIRAMPNLPASVGAGITVLYANQAASNSVELATELFQAVGKVVQIDNENMLHAVTGLSGSGPAYIFAVTEAMTEAGVNMGLPRELAQVLACSTISGAGKMLGQDDADPSALREAVTSKGGTTQAGLDALTTEANGIAALIECAITAAHNRSVELGKN